ncbi:MAG: 16S rRNA (cytosine(1402)-N(4))-methyltransferase RsmH [Nitrospira sp.]|nr:16S rRNA (cytosine(1402)-N(4))-methyltransferase RsmH [Nitrospira sp.]
MDNSIHVPVLLEEVVTWLQPRAQGCYLDCTIGLGGTAEQILKSSTPDGVLIGIDLDPHAIAHAQTRLQAYESRVSLFCENFQRVKSVMTLANRDNADGILFDLGVSSAQLDRPERGLSFQQDGPLDMRMNPTHGQTAEDLVNTLPETQLANIIHELGEERYSRRIARAIVRVRRQAPLRTTMDLSRVIRQSVPQSYRHGRLHPATRTFQAFRMAVNDELDALKTGLDEVVDVLAPGGRLCVISFHSLEDRVVKQTFRRLAHEAPDHWTILTKKPVSPSLQERRVNPRARSAKLRVLERTPGWGDGQRGHA